jgi:ABC-2 type transport system ATP-binding protein
VFVSSHLIGELSMFADDLVVVGAGRLLAAETVEAITARSSDQRGRRDAPTGRTRQLLDAPGLAATRPATGSTVRGATKAESPSSPSSTASASSSSARSRPVARGHLLEMTGASAEFASA